MPFTLFSLIAGVVVDRLDAWRTVIGTQFTQMLLASTMAVIALAGVARPWQVYVIAALMGTVQVLDAPSRQQLTFRMVGPLELPNAISLNSGVFNGARIFGPAIGGVLIAAAGAGVCFAVNAASYIAVLAGLLMMRPQEFHSVERRAHARTLYIGLKEGLSFARNHEQIRLMLMLTFVVSTFCLNFNVLLPVLAKQTLHSGPQVFGLLSAVFGVGALIGALVSAHVGRATVGLTAMGSAGFAVTVDYNGLGLTNFETVLFGTGAALAIRILPDVVRAVGDRTEVLFDSGIRRGSDIVKALALGARAVCVGRPYLWGLGAFGQPGVERVLEILRKELRVAMQQLGAPTIKDITPAMVRRA
jgi:MFS family permease